MQDFDIEKYLNIIFRRKYLIIISLLLSILGGFVYYLVVPKVYEATTLILVQPQRVPEGYVHKLVEGTVGERLRTISQQVTSRTNLEKIVAEFGLDSNYKDARDMEEVVAATRNRVKIEVKGDEKGREASTFTIAFQASKPDIAMKVANALASNFISENLKIREEQALGTSFFLTDELESVRRQLAEKENQLSLYRERYMGGLPEQLQTNLNILERLQAQLEQFGSNTRDAENRRILIQTQLAERTKTSVEVSASSGESTVGTRSLQSLKNELAFLEGRYTGKHPDVLRLRETISALERETPAATLTNERSYGSVVVSPLDAALKKQLKEVELEIVNLKEEAKNTRTQIAGYRRKVEDTPRREQELVSLNRDYENLKGIYNSLLSRKLEADIAVSMEKKQKGEQFRVIDSAKSPARPIKPDMLKILLLAVTAGLLLGGGLAYFSEMRDTSYRSPEELEEEIKLPVFLSIPLRYSEREIRRLKKGELLKAAAVSVGFAISAIGILAATRGIEETLSFVNSIFGKV